MPGLLSRIFRRKAAGEGKLPKNLNRSATSVNGHTQTIPIDPWEKSKIRREDVVELLKACCDELKLRGLDTPLFLLPFRPSSDLSSVKTFIRRYFEGGRPTLRGNALTQEIRLTEVLVLAGILRWIWTRLEGGIVGWESYELFSKAEKDSGYSRDAFNSLMPLSVGSELHTAIILDFFAFLASVAAHAKSNGFNGQRLARIAGWYAFDIRGTADGFVDGYAKWEKAANATEHLFLAYLRSIAPTPGQISAALPLSLAGLLKQTAYPPTPVTVTPIAPGATSILRITLSVRNISPTPFALLDRLARHSFVQTNPDERGDALETLIEAQSNYNDPTRALTPECLRVLKLVSATNESDELTAAFLRTPNSLGDKTWTRFADLGFEGLLSSASDSDGESDNFSRSVSPDSQRPRRRDYLGINRPKTPSWGDFLVSGFSPEGQNGSSTGFSLPPDKLLPPINTTTLPPVTSKRSLSSRDGTGVTPFRSNLHELEKGEVKSVERTRVDDALWSVWIESLCGEELEAKKAVFGRCVVAETNAPDSGRRWIVVEEIIKGAEPTTELAPPVKGKKKGFSKKTTKKTLAEDDMKRRSTSDLGRHHDEQGSVVGREMRAQALAKQSATLRTIKERQHEDLPRPLPRRKSVEYNGRPSIALGAEVSRAMRWAEGLDNGMPEYRKVEKSRLPEPKVEYIKPTQSEKQPYAPQPKPEQPKVLPTPVQLPPKPVEQIQEIPREPTVAPKVQNVRSKTPEPGYPVHGPVLLSPEPSYNKVPEKQKSPPNKLKKFFSAKSKEEKDAKRVSRVTSPLPPSPTPAAVQPKLNPPVTTAPRAPSPVPPTTKEWESDFDGTHRSETSTPIPPISDNYDTKTTPRNSETHLPSKLVEEYRPATPPTIPVVRSETPTRERKSDDEELDRWAQIRRNAEKRRNAAAAAAAAASTTPRNNTTSSDDVAEVNVPRVRQNTASPKRKVLKPGEEDEESVDARVARIRKRVQELTAGMGDD